MDCVEAGSWSPRPALSTACWAIDLRDVSDNGDVLPCSTHRQQLVFKDTMSKCIKTLPLQYTRSKIIWILKYVLLILSLASDKHYNVSHLENLQQIYLSMNNCLLHQESTIILPTDLF